MAMVKKYPAPVSVAMRWGHKTVPKWVYGAEVSDPTQNTPLVSFTVPAGKRAYIYGLYINTPEANDFELNWISGGNAQSFKVGFGAKGTLYFADIIPLNEGLAADSNTAITIKNLNAGVGNYKAGILVGEVTV